MPYVSWVAGMHTGDAVSGTAGFLMPSQLGFAALALCGRNGLREMPDACLTKSWS